MKKVAFVFIALLIGIGVLGWVGWHNKTGIAAALLKKHLHVPVTIHNLEIVANQANIQSLWIGTPKRSRTETSFACQTIAVDMAMKNIFKNPLVIEQIVLSEIFVGLEYYKDGTTNWDHILKNQNSTTASGKDYLLQRLILENLTVEVTQANGQKKRYPTIKRMEFHNLSNETGFPIEEIEKAIFKLMMKNIFDQFNLLQPQLPIPSNSPIKYLPKLFNTIRNQ